MTRHKRTAARADRCTGRRAGIARAVASWLLIAGCQGGGPAAETPEIPFPLAGTSWRVDEIDGQPVQDPAAAPTMVFDNAERVAGSAGCNLYTAPITVAGSALRVGNVATTLRACPPGVTEQETRFLTALAAVRAYRLDGDALQLLDESGRTLLRLTRA